MKSIAEKSWRLKSRRFFKRVKYWIEKYVNRFHNKNFEEITVATLDLAIKEHESLVENKGYRIYGEKAPGPAKSAINEYLGRILPKILKDYDRRGENIGNKQKYELAQLVLLNPEDFAEYGSDSSFSINDLANDHKHYASSTFFTNVYKTKKRRTKSSVMGAERKTATAKVAIANDMVSHMQWLANVYLDYKQFFFTIYDNIWEEKYNFNLIEEWVHDHYLELGFTAEKIGQNFLLLARAEEFFEIDIFKILQESGKTFSFENLPQWNWDEIKQMNSEKNKVQLKECIKQIKLEAERLKPYGPCHDLIYEYIHCLMDHAIALFIQFDHTKIFYGGHDKNFINCGLDSNSIQNQSCKEKLGFTAIEGQNGKHPWKTCYIFPSQSSNEAENELEFLKLINGNDSLDKNTLIYSSPKASATSEIQFKFLEYNIQQMPTGPKCVSLDKAPVNKSDITYGALVKHNCTITEVAAYLTSLLAGPDDNLFKILKEGDGETPGIRNMFLKFYNSTLPYPKGPRIKNFALQPMGIKYAVNMYEENKNTIHGSTMFDSGHKCGFWLMPDLYNAEKLKSGVANALLTDSSSFNLEKKQKSFSSHESLTLMKTMTEMEEYQNSSSRKHECPFKEAGCKYKNKLKWRVTKHALELCTFATRWGEERIKLDEEYETFIERKNFYQPKIEKIRREIKKNTNKRKRKFYPKRFECPDCENFSTSWRKSRKTFINHFLPGRKRCKYANDETIKELFNNHPLFAVVRNQNQNI